MNKELLNLTSLLVDSSESEESDSDLYEILLDDPESLEEVLLSELRSRKKRNCIKNYLEEIVPSYSQEEFRRHFRISKSLFKNLSEKFEQSEVFKNLRADKRLSGEKNIAVFLWFAGHEACSYRDLADRFNLSLSSVCRIVYRVTMFISNLACSVITWPNEERKQTTSRFFQSKSGIPKAIGCIDGTHITIDPPIVCKDDYIDRKGCTSIVLQAICDEKRKFTNIFVGFPGSSHDSWVLQNSPIYEKLANYCGDYYILGDSAYPCTNHLVTPYRDNGHLTAAQKDFNIKLSSSRVTIEHTFGILKQRFRQLYYCKLRGAKKLCHFIRACCVLHNIANEDDFEFIFEESPDSTVLVPRHGENTRGNIVRDTIYQQMRSHN